MVSTRTRQPQFKTLIYEEELDRIAGWAEEYPNLETGGDLFGFWTHSGAPVIKFVIGPGPKSKHNQTSFFQDTDFLKDSGELLRSKHGLQHIGEWHSHHQLELPEPSGGDENTVFRALDRYNFPRFLLCIANLIPSQKKWTVSLGSFLFSKGRANYQAGAWVVLPGESPIRSSLKLEREIPFRNYDPRQLKKTWKVEQTTLDAQPLVATEPITISRRLWYATPEGQDLLKKIHGEFTNYYGKCEMFRTPQEKVYITCEINNQQWQIEFPDDFPQSSPLLKVNNESFGVKDWSSTSQEFEQIKACIDRNQKSDNQPSFKMNVPQHGHY